MKINSAIAAAILAFTSGTYADEDAPKKASPAVVDLPTFTVSPSPTSSDGFGSLVLTPSPPPIAYQPQGSLPRAIHRRLGD